MTQRRTLQDERVRAKYGSPWRDLPPPDDSVEPFEGSVAALIAGCVGIALQGVMAYFPLLLTFFVAPLPVTLGVYAAWLILLRVAVHQREPHPWLALAIPIASAASWVLLILVGTEQFGWPPLIFPEGR